MGSKFLRGLGSLLLTEDRKNANKKSQKSQPLKRS